MNKDHVTRIRSLDDVIPDSSLVIMTPDGVWRTYCVPDVDMGDCDCILSKKIASYPD